MSVIIWLLGLVEEPIVYPPSKKPLRKEFVKSTEAQEFLAMENMYYSMLDTPKSPAGSLAMVFAFMKMLDPNSVVRESEYKAVGDAVPFIDKANLALKRISQGLSIDPKFREEMIDVAKKRYKLRRKLIGPRIKALRSMAVRRGLDVNSVMAVSPLQRVNASDLHKSFMKNKGRQIDDKYYKKYSTLEEIGAE